MLPKFVIEILRGVGIYSPLRDRWHEYLLRRNARNEIRSWTASGYPAPPPASLKHAKLLSFVRRYKIRELVETGTFHGDTVFALRNSVSEIHSIELAPELYNRAKARFKHLRNVKLYFGDSAKVLPEILRGLSGPSLFWLDGHYCEGPSVRGETDTPVAKELEAILARSPGQDVILIDDARLFTGEHDYPALDWVRKYVERKRPGALVEFESDIICVYPI